MKPLWIHPAAEDEFEGAAEFYGDQSAGLAADFVHEVEAAFSRIAVAHQRRRPGYWMNRHSDRRPG